MDIYNMTEAQKRDAYNRAADERLWSGKGNEMKVFSDWSVAFDFCREKNQPVTVMISGEKWKLYPSGSAKKILTKEKK